MLLSNEVQRERYFSIGVKFVAAEYLSLIALSTIMLASHSGP